MKKILTLFVALMFVVVAYAQANLLTTQLVVDLKEAGTLYDMLPNDQRPLITNLKIKGPINGTDVKCLREMMGKEDNLGSYNLSVKGDFVSSSETAESNLKILDLSEASIVEGGGAYGTILTGSPMNQTKTPLYSANNTIGSYMFSGCASLENLMLPSSVQVIESYALADCASLISITLPADLTAIPKGMLRGCESLEQVDVPSGVSEIGDFAFKGTGLKSFTFPEAITVITPMLSGAEKLEYIVIPSTVTSIKSNGMTGAFAGLKALKELRIPESVTGNLSDYMLSGCESLERLYIPSKAVLTWYTLRGMKTLSDMYVYSEMPQSLNTMFFQNSFNYKKTVLHVKKGCKAAYAAAYYWKDFKAIVEDADDESTGIASVLILDEKQPVSTYTLDGKRIVAPRQGVCINKYADGKVKKVLLRQR